MKLFALPAMVLASLVAPPGASGAPPAQACHENYDAGAADRLPAFLDASAPNPTQRWTLESIVEVRRITEVAMSQQAGMAAFIVKQSFVDSGAIRYGLYAIELRASRRARKLAESPYMHDLAQRPGSASWTALAEFGCGVQLYETGSGGPLHPILVNSDLVTVGGSEGVMPSAADGTHRIGVKAYQWAPDGRALWYSRPRLTPPADRASMADKGIVFEPSRVFIPFDENAALLAGTELRVAIPGEGSDREIAFMPAEATLGSDPFGPTSTQWSRDSLRIDMFLMALQSNGQSEMSRWSIDAASGERKRLPDRKMSPLEMFYGVQLPEPGGYLTLRQDADGRRLVELDAMGSVMRDFGPVAFTAFGGPLPTWWDTSGERGLLSVRYRDRSGLVTFPGLREIIPSRDDGTAENLETCSFTDDLERGACVRESLAIAPELVQVDPRRGVGPVLVRPDRQIEPLRTVHKVWPNRFGTDGDGYVTYPRNYKASEKLPVLVVTHGSDAQNRFAYDGFQWEYPIQLFAEHGYLVLSVNEPGITPRKRAAMDAWAKMSSNIGADQMQFAVAYEAVATMEAALAWAIDEGLADPEKAGIAGYSRGSHVVKFALSQSKLFKAGSAGDSSWFSASGYWLGISRNLYMSLFGGSPFDAKAVDNYRRLSPSFRTREFAGPLLQEFTTRSAYSGVELDTLLREAGIPTDLVFYLDETHILWHPKRRAASMSLNFDWFNFWLLGSEDAAPEKAPQYARWRALREKWNATRVPGK